MNLGMYKPGQGYWTRVLTAAGVGALAVGGAFWINTHFLTKVSDVVSNQSKGIVWAVVLGSTSIALWIVLNRPRVVDFMIATEAEMKKVAWPSRKTLITMTGVVIGGLLGLALLVAGIDAVFKGLFTFIHILD